MTKISDEEALAGVAAERARVGKRLVGEGYASLLHIVLVVAAGLLAWVRLPPIAQQTVWAEDGGIFLRDVLAHGSLQSIPLAYDGYLHVVPRMLVSTAYLIVPLDKFGLAVSLMACLAVAAISAAVFHLSRPVVAAAPVRFMIAVIPILLPVGPKEVLGNAANLHWYLLWLIPWLLIHIPKSRITAILLFVITFASASSEIIAAIFLPLAIWTVVKRRCLAAPLGWVAGVGWQLLTTAAAVRVNDGVDSRAMDLTSVLMGYVLLPVASNWYADSRTLGSQVIEYGGWALFFPCLIFCSLLAYVLIAGNRRLRFAALTACGASIICWVASVLVSSKAMFTYAQYSDADWENGFGYMRYAASPAMFLLLLIPLATAVALEKGLFNAKASLSVTGMFLAFLLVAFFPVTTARHTGPEWEEGVEKARAACHGDPALPAISVAVAPAGWKHAEVHISCTDVGGR